MTISKGGLALLAFLLAAGAVDAKVVTYNCQFPGAYGFFASKVRVDLDEATGGVRITDAVAQAVTGGPVAGRLHDTAKRRTFRWALWLNNSSAQRTRMDYSIVLTKGGNQAFLRGKPYGYSNDFSEKGTCTQGKG